MVSWLYDSPDRKEPGTPGFNGTTKAPRPVTRSGAILTVLLYAPPERSFRPAYCGVDKAVRYTVDDLDFSQLRNLPPVPGAPDPKILATRLTRPWIDHVHEFMGAMVHPSENMPNYGRDMARIIADAGLLANVDFDQLPGSPSKIELVIPLVQLGIDLAGVADVGGSWPENGGHGMGRKIPILFAGALLQDQHMLKVGHWETRFQDDEQTFYVSQESVDITHSDKWSPDGRAADKEPYKISDIGLPEWGIRHTRRPTADNRGWRTPYRAINGAVIPGFSLAVSIMDLRRQWNHEAYFDYSVRYMRTIQAGGEPLKGVNAPSTFVQNMWNKYHQRFALVWERGTAAIDDTAR
jgi:hypothetical protein